MYAGSAEHIKLSFSDFHRLGSGLVRCFSNSFLIISAMLSGACHREGTSLHEC